jgi:hypothetical protein
MCFNWSERVMKFSTSEAMRSFRVWHNIFIWLWLRVEPSGILTTWHIPSYDVIYSVYDPIDIQIGLSISYCIIKIDIGLSISYCIINIVLLTDINISLYTIPHCFRGKIPRENVADSRPYSGTGSRLFACGCGAMEGHFLDKSPWIKLWNSTKKRVQEPMARGAEPLRHRRDEAWA